MRHPPFAIPRTVKIRGRLWRVFREEDMSPRARSEIRGLRGASFMARREIYLAEQDSRAECQTLIHELLHACSRDPIPYEMEEALIADVEEPLTKALAQLEWK